MKYAHKITGIGFKLDNNIEKKFCMKLCSPTGFGNVTADQLKLPAVMTLKSCSRCTAWTVCAGNEKAPHLMSYLNRKYISSFLSCVS